MSNVKRFIVKQTPILGNLTVIVTKSACNRHSRFKIAAQSALNRNLKCQQSTQTIRPDGARWTPKKQGITRPSSVNEHKRFAFPPVTPLRRRIDTTAATFPDVDT